MLHPSDIAILATWISREHAETGDDIETVRRKYMITDEQWETLIKPEVEKCQKRKASQPGTS